jgi:valyl-tRNA synthetase
VRDALDHYDFGPVGQNLYRFVWNDYCDWFLELSKGRIQGSDPSAARQAGRVLGRTLAEILRLLHPIVPFITEELWGMLLRAMDEKKLWMDDRPESELLIMETFPKPDKNRDAKLEERFEAVQRLVTRVRNIRANARLTESVRLKVLVKPLDEELSRLLSATAPVLCRLANLDSIDHVGQRPEGVVTSVDPAFELYVDLGKHVDLAAEITRIDKEMASINKKLERLSKKLQNTEFLANAPEEVVKKERAKDRELNDMLDKLHGLRKEYAAGSEG